MLYLKEDRVFLWTLTVVFRSTMIPESVLRNQEAHHLTKLIATTWFMIGLCYKLGFGGMVSHMFFSYVVWLEPRQGT